MSAHQAVPGVGECAICMEIVPFVKMLECRHMVCLTCVNKLINQTLTQYICCPTCRMNTDISQGPEYLHTVYFGKIRCDVCLERKATEDMWWCGSCIHALCSKCSIKEHAQKKHNISEWNKMEPVKFCVDYINKIEYDRQSSSGAAHNRRVVRAYLDEVEKHLFRLLSSQPELDQIRNNLLNRYGSRLSTDSVESSHSPPIVPTDEAPRMIAKVLQLAGANVMDALIPSASTQVFQVGFASNPEEIASYLKTKIELTAFTPTITPIKEECACGNGEEAAPSSSTELTDKNIEERVVPRVHANLPVISVEYSISNNILLLHLASEIQIYNVANGKQQLIAVSRNNQTVRSVSLGGPGSDEVLLALQSVNRSYEWSLEAFVVTETPLMCSYSVKFDLDPEDNIEMIYVSPGAACVYEIRICSGNVSEVWRAELVNKKKDKTKLKETLVYQKGEARYTRLRAIENKANKQKFLLVWDELSCCVNRLVINKDGRCEASTTILHSVDPVPFALDLQNVLWMFDPHLNYLLCSHSPVLNRVGVTFKQMAQYSRRTIRYLAVDEEKVVGVAVSGSNAELVVFKRKQ